MPTKAATAKRPGRQPADRKPPSRPTLTRKTTRTTEDARRKAMEEGIAITVDGERYEVRIGDVTPQIAGELRARVGYGTFVLLETMMSPNIDVDILQAFMWVARRIQGEELEMADLEIDYAIMLDDKRFKVDEAPAASAAKRDAAAKANGQPTEDEEIFPED